MYRELTKEYQEQQEIYLITGRVVFMKQEEQFKVRKCRYA